MCRTLYMILSLVKIHRKLYLNTATSIILSIYSYPILTYPFRKYLKYISITFKKKVYYKYLVMYFSKYLHVLYKYLSKYFFFNFICLVALPSKKINFKTIHKYFKIIMSHLYIIRIL